MTEKEIKALVYLMEDTDEEVLKHVKTKLMTLGDEALPYIEHYLTDGNDTGAKERLSEISQEIVLPYVCSELDKWAKTGGKDLLTGTYLLAKHVYPSLTYKELDEEIERIRLDIWLELGLNLSSLEKVRVMNNYIYNRAGFVGDTEDYHAPENSYINCVLENRKGNPVSLAVVYSIIAQRLGIPLYGVNLPQHFVLAYKEEGDEPSSTAYTKGSVASSDSGGKILFYVNAFTKGSIFSKLNIDQFLKQLNIDPKAMYYEPCPNTDIIARMCRNLLHSYERENDTEKSEAIKSFLEILKPYITT